MKNCCFSFIFYCALSGVFVFIILGIFICTNNSFLIMENIKKNDDGTFTFDEDTKKIAYLQYFAAAVFDALFAVIIYVISIFCGDKKKSLQSSLGNKKEIEIISNNNIIENEIDNDNIINNNNNNIIINEIITNKNDNKIGSISSDNDKIIENPGMTEKEY